MSYTSAQLVAAYTAANDGVAPNAANAALLAAFATETQSGQLSDAAALAFVINSADSTTAVATQTYNFFTGKTPTKAGLDFLVNSATNPTDLNDPFYTQFSLENRYINFAGNLGIVGDGAAAFATNYGGISLVADPATGISNFVNVLYETIIGTAYATAAGINVTAAKVDITSRLANFIQIAKDRGLITATSTAAQQDLAVKAELVGYLMAEGIKADVGIYAASSNNFTNALINGNPLFNVDLLATYAALGGGTGSAVGGTGPTAGGSTLALTTGIDALTGTVGNDTFIGDTPTVTAADSLNGGAGTDTFRYFGNTTGALPQLTSVENVNLVNSAADISLAGATGVTFVSLDGNPTASRTITVGAGVGVGLTNINDAGNETFVTASATQAAMTATLAGGIVAGTLNLNGAGLTAR
jgi:S-layer protein